MLFFATVVFALHALGRAQTGTNSSSTLSDVAAALTEAKIVPDVIPTFNPNAGLSPIFTGSSGPVQVMPGMPLTMNGTYYVSSNGLPLTDGGL